MALALDGHAAGHAAAGATSVTATLTTANANDVIIAFYVYRGALQSGGSYGVSGGGLTWHQRVSVANGTTVTIAEFYAIASAPLSAQVITGTQATGDTEAQSLFVFGISGANTGTPFDPNAGLPSFATGSSTAPSAALSTSNANDLLIGAFGSRNVAGQTIAAPTGFTLIDTQGAGSDPNGGDAYDIVSATQAALAVTWTLGTSEPWVAMADAVQSAAVVAAGEVNLRFTTGERIYAGSVFAGELAFRLRAAPTASSVVAGRAAFGLRATLVSSTAIAGTMNAQLRATVTASSKPGVQHTRMQLRAVPQQTSQRVSAEAALRFQAAVAASSRASATTVFSFRATPQASSLVSGSTTLVLRASPQASSLATSRSVFGFSAVATPFGPPPPPVRPTGLSGGSGPILPFARRHFEPEFLAAFPEYARPLEEERIYREIPEDHEIVLYRPTEEEVEILPPGWRPPPSGFEEGFAPGPGVTFQYIYSPTYPTTYQTTYQSTVPAPFGVPPWMVVMVVLGVVFGVVALVVALLKE